MNTIKSWLTVKEAAFIVGRTPKTIYGWVSDKDIEHRVNEHGVTEIGHMSLMRTEAATRRGRPPTIPENKE